jgi:hypothetical protein
MTDLSVKKHDLRIVLALLSQEYLDKRMLQRLAQVNMKKVDRLLEQMIRNGLLYAFGQGTDKNGYPWPKLYQLSPSGRRWAYRLLGLPAPAAREIKELRDAVALYDYVAEVGEVPEGRQPIMELAAAARKLTGRWWMA